MFANPPASYKIFFPASQAKDKRSFTEKEKLAEPDFKKRRGGFGSIINTTGKRILFPKGMEKRYCLDFLDVGEVCKHGDNCTFVHALYPSGFTKQDKILLAQHVEKTDGLSFKNVS